MPTTAEAEELLPGPSEDKPEELCYDPGSIGPTSQFFPRASLGKTTCWVLARESSEGAQEHGQISALRPTVPTPHCGRSLSRPRGKVGKAATDLSLVFGGLQEQCINQSNGVGLDLLVGAVSTEMETEGSEEQRAR